HRGRSRGHARVVRDVPRREGLPVRPGRRWRDCDPRSSWRSTCRCRRSTGGRLRWLKQSSSTTHIPIVACTGRVEGSSGVDAIAAGCDAYVLKPCLPQHLLKEIRTCSPGLAGSGARRQMSSRLQLEREYTLQLYPMQLRLGDQFTDADGEWAVV